MESTLWSPDSRYYIPDSLSVELGFRIPDSMRCFPDSKAQDYGFPKQKFVRFQNPNYLKWGKLWTVTDVSTTCAEVTLILALIRSSKLVVSGQLLALNSDID